MTKEATFGTCNFPDLSHSLLMLLMENIHNHPWYSTPQGAFALDCELRLTQKMLTPWPRRGHSLLEVGCSHWSILELLWESGFDVSSIALSLPQLDSTRQHLHGKIDFHLGAADHLPFEDNSFDYVALMAPPPASASIPPHIVVHEAVRVAAKGVLLHLWNPCSLAGIHRRYAAKSLPEVVQQRLWLSWRDARGLLTTLSPRGSISTCSTLLGPPPWWYSNSLCQKINAMLLPIPLGSIIQLRLTHAPASPLTGIPLRLSSLRIKNSQPATVLERKDIGVAGDLAPHRSAK